MNEIRTLIIDDEHLAREVVKSYISKIPELCIVGEASNGFDGIKLIQDLKPELIFLDIQMPKLNGFEMLELLENMPLVVFTTAFDQYAIQAFEVNAIDYLLKPISFDRFSTTITKILQSNDQNPLEHSSKISGFVDTRNKSLERIVVKDNQRIHVISVTDVQYIEAQDDYVMIVTEGGKFIKKQTMKSLEEKLSQDVFIRVHRSYFVNINCIKEVVLFEKDSYLAKISDKISVPVSKSGYQLLMTKFT